MTITTNDKGETIVSFEEELEELRKTGFTNEQVAAIWKLVSRVSVRLLAKEGEIKDDTI